MVQAEQPDQPQIDHDRQPDRPGRTVVDRLGHPDPGDEAKQVERRRDGEHIGDGRIGQG